MRDHSPNALRLAKKLRSEMALPEVLLWRILRGKPQGVKFRRQHPIGQFVEDFYCDQRKLIIEIDGIAHSLGKRGERDERRDEWLRSRGFEVVRIPASNVLRDPDSVAESLVAMCAAAVPPPSDGSRPPPPPEGEDR